MTNEQEKVAQNQTKEPQENDLMHLSVEEKLQIFANLIVDRLLEEQSNLQASDYKVR
jgi:hypothetical protein